MASIIFVCTGNTCRSPMAMAIARERGGDGVYESRGVAVFGNLPASANAMAALARLGVSLDGHVSRALSADDCKNCDRLVTMTTAHKRAVVAAFPFAAEKTCTLSEFAGLDDVGDIPDPFGGDLDEYIRCAEVIAKCLAENIIG